MVKESKSPNSKKPPSPWQIILTFLTNNYILLLLLLLLSETILRLLTGNNDAYFLGLDRRSDDVTDSSLQVQIEAVNRKFEKEIEDLRNELNERVDDFDFVLRTKLRDSGERVESVVQSLIREERIWNDEFNKGLQKLNLKKGKGEGDFRLNEMKEYVKEMIEKAIEKHAADGLDASNE